MWRETIVVIGTVLAMRAFFDQYEQLVYIIGSVFAIFFVGYPGYNRKSVKDDMLKISAMAFMVCLFPSYV